MRNFKWTKKGPGRKHNPMTAKQVKALKEKQNARQ